MVACGGGDGQPGKHWQGGKGPPAGGAYGTARQPSRFLSGGGFGPRVPGSAVLTGDAETIAMVRTFRSCLRHGGGNKGNRNFTVYLDGEGWARVADLGTETRRTREEVLRFAEAGGIEFEVHRGTHIRYPGGATGPRASDFVFDVPAATVGPAFSLWTPPAADAVPTAFGAAWGPGQQPPWLAPRPVAGQTAVVLAAACLQQVPGRSGPAAATERHWSSQEEFNEMLKDASFEELLFLESQGFAGAPAAAQQAAATAAGAGSSSSWAGPGFGPNLGQWLGPEVFSVVGTPRPVAPRPTRPVPGAPEVQYLGQHGGDEAPVAGPPPGGASSSSSPAAPDPHRANKMATGSTVAATPKKSKKYKRKPLSPSSRPGRSSRSVRTDTEKRRGDRRGERGDRDRDRDGGGLHRSERDGRRRPRSDDDRR
jgi:hypothetical protein